MPKPKKRRSIPRPVFFETTIPVVRPCARCGVWFAAGRAEGMPAEVEFTALDPGQQIWATLNRIELYCIRRSGLIYMDATRLSGKPFGAIYPQHRCSVRWPPLPPNPEQAPKHRDSQVPPF